jgi:hypothetical protein
VRLFHFSDNGSIDHFEPRPVLVPSTRRPGEEWLNGPLVWAVDEDHEATYLFPRETARILLWATKSTTASDREQWLGPSHDVVAYVETHGLAQLREAVLYRYELPATTFTPTSDDWMWVSRHLVVPESVERIDNLELQLRNRGVDVRVSHDLDSLRAVWQSTVHASGIRLRNARSWTTDDS